MPLKKNNKRKKTTYDPSLKQGYDLLNNLSEQTVREIKSRPNIHRNVEAPQYSDAGEFIGSVDASQEKENKLSTPFLGWFRDMANQFIESGVQNDEAQLHDINVELANLDEIEEYRDLLRKAEDIRKQVSGYQKRGMNTAAEYVMKQNQDVFDRIKQLDNTFKNDRRFTSAAVASLMYDRNKADVTDKALIAANYLHHEVGSDPNAGFFRKRVVEPLVNIANLGVSVIESAAVSLDQLFGASKGEKTRQYIQSMPYDDPVVQKLYRGSSYADMNTAQFTKELRDYRKDLERQKNQKLAELGEDLYTQRTGNMHAMQFIQAVPVLGDIIDKAPSWSGAKMLGITDYASFGERRRADENYKKPTTNVWHPEEGTAGWKKEREEQGDSLWEMFKHPAVSLLQMGSSVSMMKYSLGAMSADFALMGIQSLLGMGAMKTMNAANKAGMIANEARALEDLTRVERYSKAANRYKNLSTGLQGAITGVTGANVGIGAASIVMSRENETNLERIQAIGQRVLKNAYEKDINLADVYAPIINAAERKGIDTSKLGEVELIQLGLALGVQTGNEEYDNLTREATKGIYKLINANNALFIKDFAQLMPWTSYGGKALNAFTRRVTNTRLMRKITGTPEAYPMYLPKGMKMSDLRRSDAAFTGILDATVDKIAKRFFNKDLANVTAAANNIRKALDSKAIVKYLGDKAKLIGFEGVSEGIEEGQQEIFQQLYQQGAYDDYIRPYDMFDTGEMFDNIDVAKQALFAYVGLNDDPRLSSDEIRKAMNIGFMAAIGQSGIMGAARNANSNQEGTIRDLISTLKNDKTISRLIGEHYDSVDDQNHMEFFYEALKNGSSATTLASALFDIRANVDESNNLVKHSYVENDINMLYNVASLMNNKEWEKFINENEGAGKYSDIYKRATINGAKALTSYDTATRLRAKASDKMFGVMRRRSNIVENIARDITMLDSEDEEIKAAAKERLEQLKASNPAEYQFAQTMLSQYGAYSNVIDALNKATDERDKAVDEQNDTTKKPLQKRNPLEKQDRIGFVKSYVEFLHRIIQQDVLTNLIKQASDQKVFLDGFRKLTGLDYDTTTLGQMIDVLNKQLKRSKELEDSVFVTGNYRSALGELAKLELVDTDELTDAFTSFYMNDSVAIPMATLASAYQKFSVNPHNLKDALYGETRQSTDEDLSKMVSQHDQLRDKLHKVADVNEEYVDPFTIKHDMDKLSEKAAKHLIHKDLENSEHRRLIANQEWIEETPVTEEDINNAEAGDPNSQEKVNTRADQAAKQAKEQSDEEQGLRDPSDVPIDETEAGKRLSSEYENRDEDEESRKREMLEKQRGRQQSEEEEGEEEEESPEPTVTQAGEENSSQTEQPDEPKPEVESEEESEEKPEPQPEPEQQNEEEDSQDGANDDQDDNTPEEDEKTDDALEEASEEGASTDVDREAAAEESAVDDIDREAAAEDEVRQRDAIENQLANEDTDNLYDPDELTYDSESDTFFDGDNQLSPEESDKIKKDLDPNAAVHDPNKINATWDSIGSMVANTLFYSVNPKVWDEPMSLKIGDKDVFDSPLNTAHQLSERLLQRGWLEKANKYFIVTEPTYVVEHATKNADRYDNMTVVMIIESGNERYAVALRGLSKTWNDVETKSGKIRRYYNVEEIEIKNSLRVKGVDLDKIVAVAGNHAVPAQGNTEALVKFINKVLDEQTLDRGLAVAKSIGIDEQDAETWWKNGPEKMPEALQKKYSRNSQALNVTRWRVSHKEVDLAIRRKFAQTGKTVMSNEDIESQIKQLREFRNQIIDVYLVETETVDKKTGAISTKKELPSRVRTDVKPTVVSQSNGVFDNVKDEYDRPVYRKVGKANASIDEIEAQINNGELLFGYGHGVFGERDENGQAFQITGVRESDATTVYPGTGKSGSIYWLVSGPSGSATRTPVMLHKESFDTQERIVNGERKQFHLHRQRRYSKATNSIKTVSPLEMCLVYDKTTRSLINQKEAQGYIPSTAEILMYMLCRRFDFVGIKNNDDISDIIEFFIHSGERTILKNQPKVGNDPMNFLASKQLYFGVDENNKNKPTLWIGIGNKQSGYKLTPFVVEELFADTPQAAQDRITVTQAIATQMTWNTDLAHMRDSIDVQSGNSAIARFIRGLILNDESLRGLTVDEQLGKTVSIMGNSQLSFKVSDFFYKNDNGELKAKDRVSVLAWMIANQKIDTDVSENIFKQPFVFAYGVASQNNTKAVSTKNAINRADENETGGVSVARGENKEQSSKRQKPSFSLYDPKRIEELSRGYESAARRPFQDRLDRGLSFPTTEEERKQTIENINNSVGIKRRIKRHGEGCEVIDRIFLTANYLDDDVMNADNAGELAKVLTKRVNDFIDKYNEAYGTEIKHTTVRPGKAQDLIGGFDTGFMYMDIQKNGEVNIQVDRGDRVDSWSQQMTGIYSKVRAEGSFDEKSARQWLKEKLGLDDHNVVVRNAIIRSCYDGDVYGLTNVYLDALAGMFNPMIQLSKQSGTGVTYHEAWHYVNLLLNDQETRYKIWKDYLDTHKEFKNRMLEKYGKINNKDIEEALAEEFRKYVQGRLDTSLKGRVKRLLNNVLDLIIASRRKSEYRQLFKAIQNGHLVGKPIDQSSAMQFKKVYPYGAPSINHSIAGFNEDTLRQLEGIDTATDLFKTLNAVVRKIISDFNIDSIEKMKELSGNVPGKSGITKEDILDKVDSMIEHEGVTDTFANMLQDVYDNPELLFHALTQEFAKLGVRLQFKKGEDNTVVDESTNEVVNKAESATEKNEAKRRENQDSFTYDQMRLTVSKKENAATLTKMFFWSIPVLVQRVLKNGTKSITASVDEFGSQMFYDFNQAWTKMLTDLWMCTSLDDVWQEDVKNKVTGAIIHKAGEYKASSIFGRVQDLAKADVFYESLMRKLKSISEGKTLNPQLRSQIFSTINSYKSQICYIELSDPYSYFRVSDEDFGSYEGEDFETTIGQQMRTALVNDVSRRWLLQDDSLLQVQRALPRRWSKQIASLGLISYKKRGGVVNKAFVDRVVSDHKHIAARLANITKMDKKTKAYVLNDAKVQEELFGTASSNGVKADIVQFLNSIGINMDMQSLDMYISIQAKDLTGRGTPVRTQAAILHELFTNNAKSLGSIGLIVNKLKASVGQSEFSETNAALTRGLDQLYNNYQSRSYLSRLAIAYNAVHPASSEFSVRGPGDKVYYPINQNNYITDRIVALNDKDSGLAESLIRDPYARRSKLASIASSSENNSNLTNIRAEVFVGMKDKNRQTSGDYFGINSLEDYLSKMWMTENNMLVIPTMADKKTWYALKSTLFKKMGLFHHDLLVTQPNQKLINRSIYRAYNEINPIDNFEQLYEEDEFDDEFRTAARKWFYSLDTESEAYRSIISEACEEQLSFGVQVSTYQDEGGYLSFRPRFSHDALTQMAGYFLDELDALIAYYNEDNIKALLLNPNKLQENFHGKVMKNGRLDFSGNGGKFRYFYDLGITPQNFPIQFNKVVDGKSVKAANLNQILQSLFILQQRIESDNKNEKIYVDDKKQEAVDILHLLSLRQDKSGELDGFELIREYLKELRSTMVNSTLTLESYSDQLLHAINEKLQNLVRSELNTLSQDGPLHLVDRDEKTGGFKNYAIPEQFLNQYVNKLKDFGFKATLDKSTTPMVIYSIVANNLLNNIISTIEFEKIFAGDPAQYKWKGDKKRKDTIMITGFIGSKPFAETSVQTDILTDIASDKIKRLGSELSPGDNIRTVFNEEERKKYNVHTNSKYTILDVEDVEAKSVFLEQTKRLFSTQLLVDYIMNKKPESFDKFVEQVSNEVYEHKTKGGQTDTKRKLLSQKDVIQMLYKNQDVYNRYYEMIPDSVKQQMQESIDLQTKPYSGINVADAQVFIRPDMYRRIRIGLGDWSFEVDSTGYSDEDAYNILEYGYYIKNGKRIDVEDGQWLTDNDLAKKVAKFQTYPLKMSYFQNDSERQPGKNYFRNRTTLNKMAIFALFRFHRSTDVGKMMYDRMNAKGNEIDMIAFKSAIKVGAVQNGAKVMNENADVEHQVSDLSEQLKLNDDNTPVYVNDQNLNYTNGETISNNTSNTLSIKIQDLNNLRFQLNTKAHEHDERNIGTQMLKIAFSNIYDDYDYGQGLSDRPSRKGSIVRKDIMNTVKLINTFGQIVLRDEFYSRGSVNRIAIKNWLAKICLSNGLGTIAHQIIMNGGSASSLMARTVFENSASSLVNDNTVNIETAGGTAIQQSIIGFAAYEKNQLSEQITQDGTNHYTQYNNGEELKWNAKDGSLQVLLSANFFRAVVPQEYRGSYESMRKWLLDNNVIGSKSKPFGVGYRIPTQGQSSMFVMQVADIIPAQSGDTIVVPREFTSQTGSDFDVDKLFIATKTYVDGHVLDIDDDTFNKMAGLNYGKNRKELFDLEDAAAENWARHAIKNFDELSPEDKELAKAGYDMRRALSNRLLQNYMDILGDKKTYAAAHASIDTITSKIQDALVKPLRGGSAAYTYGLSTMTPSFQAYRKMEFSVGKAGIAPFALNITNLSLTQTTHLSMDFNHLKSFELKPLDSIYAEDNSRIADWLSAMVNAHVDVAKDPYIFVLNINKTTYNMTNFLLRTGKTLGAFTFLAQPVIKEFAQKVGSGASMYGNNVNSTVSSEDEINKIKESQVILGLYKKYVGSDSGGEGIIKALLKYNESLPETSKQKLSKDYVKYLNSVCKFYRAVADKSVTAAKKEGVHDPFENKADIINYDNGINAINAIREEEGKDITKRDLKKLLSAYVFQLGTLHAWQLLKPSADKLAQLVHESQIDTEKFGNTLAKQINFQNKYEQFKNMSGGWILNIPNFGKIVNKIKEEYLAKVEKNTGVDAHENGAGIESKYALHKYFGDTWLDYMFYSARRYTQELLSGQVFPATKEFKSIFKYIMGAKFGYTSWTDFNGFTHEGYNPNGGANDKVAQEVSNAIDNVMRAVAFTKIGYSVYEDIRRQYPDAIDFTMNGSTAAVYEKMRELIYGTSKQADIFTRTRQLINDIQTYKGNSNKYELLRDPITHDVTNPLLLYLNPIPKVGDDPIGKMSLARMQSLTSDEEKVQLQSAFSQLLSHPDENIKALAYDLAFYAYYSQYDQNKSNSFFDLVPYEYRVQYDETLRRVCVQLDDFSNESSRKEVLLQMLQNDNYDVTTPLNIIEAAFSDMILDIIARNYNNNESIVSTYYVKQQESTLDSKWGDVFGDLVQDDDMKVFPSYLLSTSVRNHPKYINVKSAGKKLIYQRIGTILRSRTDSDKHGSSFYIYIPVQKLGYQSKNISQYEFVVDDIYGSLFHKNKIAGEFRESVVRKNIERYVQKFKSSKYDFDIIYDNEEIPVSRNSESAAYLNITEGKNRDDRKLLGGTAFADSSAPESKGGGKADVIINFVPSSVDVTKDNVLNNDKLKNKAIVVSPTSEPSEIIDKILSFKQDKPIRIHFTTPLFDTMLANSSDISDQEVDEHVQTRMDILTRQYENDPTINRESIPDIIESEREDLKRYAKYNIAQKRFNQFISKLTGLLIQNQVEIERFTASSTRRSDNKNVFKTMLAKSVKEIKDQYPQYFQKQNIVYVNSKYIYQDPKARNKYLYYIQQRVSDGIANINYTPLEATEKIDAASFTLIEDANKVADRVKEVVDNSSVNDEFGINDFFGNITDTDSADIVSENAENEENKDSAQNKECK